MGLDAWFPGGRGGGWVGAWTPEPRPEGAGPPGSRERTGLSAPLLGPGRREPRPGLRSLLEKLEGRASCPREEGTPQSLTGLWAGLCGLTGMGVGPGEVDIGGLDSMTPVGAASGGWASRVP